MIREKAWKSGMQQPAKKHESKKIPGRLGSVTRNLEESFSGSVNLDQETACITFFAAKSGLFLSYFSMV
jgi:hypothetical protein